MVSVMMLPVGKLCLIDGRSKIPDNAFVFGSDSDYYDNEGNLLPEFKNLPRYKPGMNNESAGTAGTSEDR